LTGVGIVLAAGITGETGARLLDPQELGRLCTYAGISPKTHQSGGPDAPANQSGKRMRYNRVLRDYLIQAVRKQEQWGPEEIQARIAYRKNAKGAFKFVIARQLLRIFCALARTQMIYLPPQLRTHRSNTEQRAAYIQEQWPKMREKWRR